MMSSRRPPSDSRDSLPSGSLALATWEPGEVELLGAIGERLAPEVEAIAVEWTDAIVRRLQRFRDVTPMAAMLAEANRRTLERHFAALRDGALDAVFENARAVDLAILRARSGDDPELRSSLSELHLSLESVSRVVSRWLRRLFEGDPRLGEILSVHSRLTLVLAETLAVSFHEVRSEESMRALRTASSLLEASRELNARPESVQAVLDELTRIVTRLTRCDRSLVFLWRPGEEAYAVEAALGFSAEQVEALRSLRFRRGDFPLIDDLLDGELVSGHRDDGRVPADMMERFGEVVYAVAPMRGSLGQRLGTLAAYRAEARPFDRADLEILEGMARNAALAIENALLVEELAQARDEALEAIRLKSAFLANVSHEIRTPLNVILGYASLISSRQPDGTSEPEGNEALVDGMERASRRLSETIHGILDIARLETGSFEVRPVALRMGSLVEEIVRELEDTARDKGISLEIEALDGDPSIRFDEYCLARAVRSVIGNAVKFTASGGVRIRLGRDAEGVLSLEVHDTGVGIDAAFLERLFEPFAQEDVGATRRYEGAGLGLALSRRYLELHGARISVESRKGRGTRVAIVFPRGCEENEPVADREPPAPAVAAGKYGAVLVVEDDPDSQTFMRRILGPEYRILVASGGIEVRRILGAGVDVGLVLMDLSLRGGEDGLDLTRWIRGHERLRHIPVVATTAHAFPRDRSRALEAGCDAYMAKPLDVDELLRTVEAFLSAGRRAAIRPVRGGGPPGRLVPVGLPGRAP